MNSITLNNFDTPNTFKERLAQKVLHLCIQRRVFSSNTEGVVFCVWRRNERFVVAFNADAIDTNLVNDDFCHRLSTRIDGRKVSRTNTIGMFLQVSLERPAVQMPLETRPLDLSQQPTPWHVPVGMTREGALWIDFQQGFSYLVSGISDAGKSGEIHAFIQSLLHGQQTLVYVWDFKGGAEYGRYVGTENFYFRLDALAMLNELESTLRERKKILTESGYPNIRIYNEAKKGIAQIPPIAMIIDEAAELPDGAKDKLIEMIRVQRYTGLHPVVATNQPTVAAMFPKNNLSTRIAFRVPHHTDSVTILGYKGAESLPAVRGRGLILWGGNFVEFQSFEVTYPMPSQDAMKEIGDQLAAESEQSAVSSEQSSVKDDPKVAQIKLLISKGETDASIVRKVFGVNGGGSFYKKVRLVKAFRTSSSTSSSINTPVLSLEGAG